MGIRHPIPNGTKIKFRRLGRRCKNEPHIVEDIAVVVSSSSAGSDVWYRLDNKYVLKQDDIVEIIND